jgi:hypothetical protein
MSIGRLEGVPLRDLWKHEGTRFTVWLEENIDLLSEILNIPLTVIQREKPVGPFWVDLFAEDQSGNAVIIENQLEATNHDHLGKVLTYLSNLEAKTAIWITSEQRPEHIRAVSWLNESTPADVSFYLLRLSAFKIGNSDPAPLFTIIVAPSIAQKEIGHQKNDLAERHIGHLKFWEQLLSRAKAKSVTIHSSCSPSKSNYIWASAGRPGLGYLYYVYLDGRTAVELYIDTNNSQQNKQIFDSLYKNQNAIEEQFGDSLVWERLDEKRASKVRYIMYNGGLNNPEEDWVIIHGEMIEKMKLFADTLKPYIQNVINSEIISKKDII